MATNQVIHGSNRVVENPNRYKLNAVSGQANTYDLEKVPGTITDNGTPYNKIILDKIDNVLSYLTPSVERESIIIPKPISAANLEPSDITETLRENVIIEKMNVNFPSYSGTNIKPLLKIHTDNSNIILAGNASSTNKVSTYIQRYGSTYYENFYFTTFFSSSPSNFELSYRLYNTSQILYMDYDFKGIVSCIYNYNYANNNDLKAEFYTSEDGVNWTFVANATKGSNQTFSIINARYFRVKNYNTTVFTMGRSYITNIIGNVDIINYMNNFTLDNNGNTFTNNQRVLIETPSTTDLTSVVGNTLNGIDIPTLLQSGTKYELIYNESEDKFELGGGNTLIDIAFTEKTYAVDLSAIKLKKGKLYMFKVTNTSANAYLAKTSTGTDIQIGYFALICPLDNGTFTIDYTTAPHNYDTTIDEIKYIYASAGWNAGCRLVLMEV